MEMSPTPQAALRHGDRLAGLCPDAGHLVHMATHIDVLCGDYQSVVARNHAAAAVHPGFRPTYQSGRKHAGAQRHRPQTGPDRRAPLRQELLHAGVPRPLVPWPSAPRTSRHRFRNAGCECDKGCRNFAHLHSLCTFYPPLPEDTTLYASTNALILYSRAVALANLGRPDAARTEAAKFHAAYDAIPEERRLFQNKARDVLAVAREMMMGEVAFKGGDTSAGLDHLREAVRLDDSLYYEEPWAWPQPTRHALGALLLTAGHWDEAESVYRADLGLDGSIPRQLQNPNNIWALQGLLECLEHRGEAVERVHIKQQLDQAQARADIAVSASCFCRSSCPK